MLDDYIKEENIVKNETYEALKDLIICPICECLMIEPMLCTKCQNTYCKKCIDSWKKKGGSCPNRCNSEIQKVIQKKNLISKIKFKCIKGCGAEILFDDLEKHYSTNCILKKKNFKKIDKKDIKDNQKVKYFNRKK
jgi:hypothetical protein